MTNPTPPSPAVEVRQKATLDALFDHVDKQMHTLDVSVICTCDHFQIQMFWRMGLRIKRERALATLDGRLP